MPTIVYHLPDGTTREIDVPVGQSVMDGSVRNNLPGIVAECGGSCSCATCHVYLDEPARDEFDAAGDEERELLEFLDGVRPESRLSCQLIVAEHHDDIHIRVADSNG